MHRLWYGVTGLVVLVAAMLMFVGLPVSVSSEEEQSTPVEIDGVVIMPLGDSITGSPGCWRRSLWQQLQAAEYQRYVFFTGTQSTLCSGEHDPFHEGHTGALATELADDGSLDGWLDETHPDIVLMHLGTNDIWRGAATDEILDAFTVLLEQMRADNPTMTLLVAQIIPMNPPNCAECGAEVAALNAELPAWADAHGTEESPVIVVDQWTGFDTAVHTDDGVHPNDSGDQQIADTWFAALDAILAD